MTATETAATGCRQRAPQPTHTLLYGETPRGSLSLLVEGTGPDVLLDAAHVHRLQAWMAEHDAQAIWQAHATTGDTLAKAMADVTARGCLR